MSATQNWNSFFSSWPASLPRRGVLQTVLNEAMPFKEFWIKDGMLLVERTTPDAMGARFVLLDFEAINVMKFTDPLSPANVSDAGFQSQAPAPQRQLAGAAS